MMTRYQDYGSEYSACHNLQVFVSAFSPQAAIRMCEDTLQPVDSECDRRPYPFSAHQSFPKRNPLETEPFNHSKLHGCRMQGCDTSLAGQIWERLDISEEPLYAQNRSCFCRLRNPFCILMPRPCAFTTAVQPIVPSIQASVLCMHA